MTIKAIVHEEDGGYWAEVPSMPGCVTESDDLDGLVLELWDAIEGWTATRLRFEPEATQANRFTDELELLLSAKAAAKPFACSICHRIDSGLRNEVSLRKGILSGGGAQRMALGPYQR